jgi:hypothetical protein
MHANTQGEGTRQGMVTDVGSTNWLDNKDAVPADGATNPPNEDTKTDDLRQNPSRNKKGKIGKKRWNATGTDEE